MRIAMLQEAGFGVEAVAFERQYHSGRLPECQVESLGSINHGQYLARGVKMIRAIPLIRKTMARNDIVYCSGADMALICLIAGAGLSKPVVLEVGDVRELQVSDGIIGRMVRLIDRYLVRSCSLLVVTAPRFLDVYYREWLGAKTPGLVIENKLEASFVADTPRAVPDPTTGKPLVDRPLRIGYFGLLRDEWSWNVLKTLAEELPDKVEIVLAGLPMDPLLDLPKWVGGYPNIEYRGEYRSPGDLPSLYNSVDMVWACYPPIKDDDWNLRWARPNRFYQSCFFGKPLFSRDGCQDAIDVEKYDIGKVISDVTIDDTVRGIAAITPTEILRWTDRAQNLPKNVYSYSSEVEDLRKAIVAILE